MTNATELTLAQVAALPTDSKVGATHGVVEAIGHYRTSVTGATPEWTSQTVMLQDGPTVLRVVLWNRPPCPPEWLGRALRLVAKHSRNTTYGLKTKVNPNGEIELHATITAEVVVGDPAANPAPPSAPPSEPLAASAPAPTIHPKTAAPVAPAQAPAVAQQSPVEPSKCRCIEIRYDRTHNFARYCSESIGITLVVQDGEKADEVLAKARAWVTKRLSPPVTE